MNSGGNDAAARHRAILLARSLSNMIKNFADSAMQNGENGQLFGMLASLSCIEKPLREAQSALRGVIPQAKSEGHSP
jgi:hypothetical protein